jgi:hypothetical protein
MTRKLLIPVALGAALLVPVAASAGQDSNYVPTPPVATTPPAPTPTAPPVVTPPPVVTQPIVPVPVPLPTTGAVTDIPSANAFTRAFAIRNAPRFLRADRNRVRVTDVNTTCLRSPVSSGNFGCVFAIQAAVVARNSHRYDWGDLAPARAARAASRGGHDRRVRVERFGCLGEIDIVGGASVQPVASVDFLDCARIPNSVTDVPIVTPLPTSG